MHDFTLRKSCGAIFVHERQRLFLLNVTPKRGKRKQKKKDSSTVPARNGFMYEQVTKPLTQIFQLCRLSNLFFIPRNSISWRESLFNLITMSRCFNSYKLCIITFFNSKAIRDPTNQSSFLLNRISTCVLKWVNRVWIMRWKVQLIWLKM